MKSLFWFVGIWFSLLVCSQEDCSSIPNKYNSYLLYFLTCWLMRIYFFKITCMFLYPNLSQSECCVSIITIATFLCVLGAFKSILILGDCLDKSRRFQKWFLRLPKFERVTGPISPSFMSKVGLELLVSWFLADALTTTQNWLSF